jgi:hypothetical protein
MSGHNWNARSPPTRSPPNTKENRDETSNHHFCPHRSGRRRCDRRRSRTHIEFERIDQTSISDTDQPRHHTFANDIHGPTAAAHDDIGHDSASYAAAGYAAAGRGAPSRGVPGHGTPGHDAGDQSSDHSATNDRRQRR